MATHWTPPPVAQLQRPPRLAGSSRNEEAEVPDMRAPGHLHQQACHTCNGCFLCCADKEAVLVDLQKKVKLLTQKEAASSKQQKALEAQVNNG